MRKNPKHQKDLERVNGFNNFSPKYFADVGQRIRLEAISSDNLGNPHNLMIK
jgi:hypothetical protein